MVWGVFMTIASVPLDSDETARVCVGLEGHCHETTIISSDPFSGP